MLDDFNVFTWRGYDLRHGGILGGIQNSRLENGLSYRYLARLFESSLLNGTLGRWAYRFNGVNHEDVRRAIQLAVTVVLIASFGTWTGPRHATLLTATIIYNR